MWTVPKDRPIAVAEVRLIVACVKKLAKDYEAAHRVEDELHRAVLQTIANMSGADYATGVAQTLAREALETTRIKFPRYTA